MDIIFDIDGTLADASHRLHLIKDPSFWVHLAEDKPLTPDWEKFLSDEEVAKDLPIPQTWHTMNALLDHGHRVLFITGRSEKSRDMTWKWLTDDTCPNRKYASGFLKNHAGYRLYMRKDGDRRPSSKTKEQGLIQARLDGYNPVMVFEDRKDDTEMWRRNGLLCCQVADGNY